MMGLVVLVTGAAGNLGQQVCQGLRREGHRIRALDIPASGFGELGSADGVEIIKGDVRDSAFVRGAVEGCQWVIHLAAILPPVSERNHELTMSVNLRGTQNLLNALEAAGAKAPLVFASTVATYGDTNGKTPPVKVEHPLRPLDSYSQSKAKAEDLLRERGYPFTILRITGVAVPALLELPEPWPFSAEQRLEFVDRNDATLALIHSVGNRAVLGHTFNIAGGDSWQLHGREYVQGYYETYGIPLEEARFANHAGPYDWYDTFDSQRMLDYQRTSYLEFLAALNEVVKDVFGE
jgi:nucleoside-diphosphate-sugar epimerase